MKRNNIYIIQLISALVLLFSSCSQEELMDQPGCIRFRQDSPPAIPVTTGRHPGRYGSWRK